MKFTPLAIAAFGLCALAAPALALESSVQLVLGFQGNLERNLVTYDCDGDIEPFGVEYINAAPNFLAILPVGNDTLVFANVIAASGARYASGQYEWWTKGAEASLIDHTAPEGTEPLACIEANDIP